MGEMPGLPDVSDDGLSEFLSNLPRCVRLLEESVRDLRADFWDEPRRRRACEIAQALSEGCKVCGFKETAGVLRALLGLLSLPYGDACAIRTPLEEKLAELLSQLREHARATSA